MAVRGRNLATIFTVVLLPLPPRPSRRSKTTIEHLQRRKPLPGPLLKEMLEKKGHRSCSRRWSSPPSTHHQKLQILARDPEALLLNTGKTPKNLHLHLGSTPAPLRRHLRPAEPAEKARDRPGRQGETLRGGRRRAGEGRRKEASVSDSPSFKEAFIPQRVVANTLLIQNA
jgi:hypothetical protein